VDELTQATVRLSAKMKLSIAPGMSGPGGLPQVIQEGWYTIATDHTRAIVVVSERSSTQNDSTRELLKRKTGFVIRGSVLSRGWGDKPVFVTASHVLRDSSGTISPGKYTGFFPGVNEQQIVEFDRVLWQSAIEDFDLAVLAIKEELPFGAIAVTRLSGDDMSSTPVAALGEDSPLGPPLMIPSFVVFREYRDLPSRTGFQLAISQLLGRRSSDTIGGNGTAPVRLIYRPTSLGGIRPIGAPVFYASSGDLLCVVTQNACTWVGNVPTAIRESEAPVQNP
jgi:hypothetical protein